MAILARNAVARITPSSIGRIGQAVMQTLTAISMLVISLSDAISKLLRMLTRTSGMPGPPPGTPAAPA
eukprot:2113597-Rhodomonas_salina.1